MHESKVWVFEAASKVKELQLVDVEEVGSGYDYLGDAKRVHLAR